MAAIQHPNEQYSALLQLGRPGPQMGSPPSHVCVVPPLPPPAPLPPAVVPPAVVLVPPALSAPPTPEPAPPLPVEGEQLAGRSASVLPAQSSHSPQVLPHCVFLTQRGQAVWSSSLSSEQVATSKMSTLVPPGSCTVQQPKQSQPFCVSREQNLTHVSLTIQLGSVAGSVPSRQPVA